MMMRIAEIVATRGTCDRLKVGCVITNHEKTNIISMGYNGSAKGMDNRCESTEPGKCGHLHAEENALIKVDYSIPRKLMFVTHAPCSMCAKRIINGNVKEVHYRNRYRDDSGIRLLELGGVTVRQMPNKYEGVLETRDKCRIPTCNRKPPPNLYKMCVEHYREYQGGKLGMEDFYIDPVMQLCSEAEKVLYPNPSQNDGSEPDHRYTNQDPDIQIMKDNKEIWPYKGE